MQSNNQSSMIVNHGISILIAGEIQNSGKLNSLPIIEKIPLVAERETRIGNPLLRI